ncbi:unnamed protein product, partial [Discosporangium mesarthrocarpum]
EESILYFVATGKCQKRISKYSGVLVYSSDVSARELKLPKTFHGSPASEKQIQLNGMPVVSCMGKPHLMVSFTCNTSWPEIKDNVLPCNRHAMGSPDLRDRVFKIKLKFILHDLNTLVFGKSNFYLHVID